MHSECLSGISVARAGEELRCHACNSLELHSQFRVPLLDGPHRYDKNERNRTFYKCKLCGHFSADSYDPAQYAEYYASLSDDYHSCHDDDQFRYKQILPIRPKQSVARVLDIGCGTGTFLAMFPRDVERFGIEPSRIAAGQARAKGIEVVQYDDLAKPELRNTFDLVTAIDVVEHLADLQGFRRHLTTALRPGGTVILLTGNAESRPAQLLGPHWSYLNYAEHITFFCPSSVQKWLQTDFSHIEVTTVSHHLIDISEVLSLIRVWLLFPLKWLLRKLLPVRLNMYTSLSLPNDHMLVRAIRK
jgi:SAM-dependent methyltransferase